MLKEPTRRIRFLTRDEAPHVLAELPDHLADMAAFSLATGLRAFNVTGLQWTEVDLTRRLAWVHPDQAKARKAIAVPLNAEAVSLVRKQLGKHLTHVFSFRGKPSTQVSAKACTAHSSARRSATSVGTTCGTPGRAGTCRTARRCRIAGVRGLGVDGDGAALCAPCCRSPGALRGTPQCVACRRKNGRHKYGTALKKERARIAASP